MNAAQSLAPLRAPDSPRAPRWIRVCALEDIPVLGSRVVTPARGGNIALFRAADDFVFALLDRCPHKGGPLSQGIVFGHRVACPLHNWTIELATGEAAAPDVGCARRFAVRVDPLGVWLDASQIEDAPQQPMPAVAGPADVDGHLRVAADH